MSASTSCCLLAPKQGVDNRAANPSAVSATDVKTTPYIHSFHPASSSAEGLEEESSFPHQLASPFQYHRLAAVECWRATAVVLCFTQHLAAPAGSDSQSQRSTRLQLLLLKDSTDHRRGCRHRRRLRAHASQLVPEPPKHRPSRRQRRRFSLSCEQRALSNLPCPQSSLFNHTHRSCTAQLTKGSFP